MPKRILSISYDSVLLETRQLMLEQAGYEVVSADGFAEAAEYCKGEFDLIIMGHSIPQKDKRAIIAELKRNGCHATLLSLLRRGEQPIPEAIRGVDPYPKDLLNAVKELFGEPSVLNRA